jgi:hypothetical protein
MLVIAFIVCQGLAGGATLTVFKDGWPEATAVLDKPAFTSVVNLSIPAECRILKASVNISSVRPAGAGGGWPERVEVLLDGTTLWSFTGPDLGALGMQDRFLNGNRSESFSFNASGGSGNVTFRIPKKAVVLNATVDVSCNGSMKPSPIKNVTGEYDMDGFGRVAAGAGDLNGDGFDDIVVGMPGDDKARIFFGGREVNSTPNITLSGAIDDYFGQSVCGAGDVNGDGYDDLIIGAPDNSTNGAYAGAAFIYYGGKNFDSVPDVVLNDSAEKEYFGYSVSRAGDINADGYDDVIVGTSSSSKGKAFAYFGGDPMDSVCDLVMYAPKKDCFFGQSVSDAGDVNGDGVADFIVGARDNGLTVYAGYAYIFLGGRSIDNSSDITLTGYQSGSSFGCSVSGAGDVNGDGYDDILVGADYKYSSGNIGEAYLFFGGSGMDSIPDVSLTGQSEDDRFGHAVSGLGDINDDGYDDYGVGAPRNTSNGVNSGKAYIYYGGSVLTSKANRTLTGRSWDWLAYSISDAGDVDSNGYENFIVGAEVQGGNGYVLVMDQVPGILDPRLETPQGLVWNRTGYSNGTWKSPDFSSGLNTLLNSSSPSGNDSAGNKYVDCTIMLSGKDDGSISVSNLSIIYALNVTVADFTAALAKYQSAHKGEKDAEGNMAVPITVRSSTPGGVRLWGLNITVDEPPVLVQGLPDREMDEDSSISELYDLHQYFSDDYDDVDELQFGLKSSTNGSRVRTAVSENRFLSLNAEEGSWNDNWTGAIDIVVNCTDRWGFSTESNTFRVTVRNVPDAPVFTSTPVEDAIAGMEYTYDADAADGDAGDVLNFSLVKGPAGMMIDQTGGEISWTPDAGGSYPVSVSVTDGLFTARQDYSIFVPNRKPRLTNTSVPDATLNEQYTYNISAADDDNDRLTFTLTSTGYEGMYVDKSTGKLIWTPRQTGTFPIEVSISDGEATILYTFKITVKQGNRPPRFGSTPVSAGMAGLQYSYDANASDPDGDTIVYSLAKGPEGMAIDNATGMMTWTPARAGSFPVTIKASDGKGLEASQDFTVLVANRTKPRIELISPSEGQKVKGQVTASGRTIKGTLAVIKVELRVDSGDWAEANGTATWTFQLDTTRLQNGRHTLQARVFDGMDYGVSANRTITVDNQKKAADKASTPGFEAVAAAGAVAVALLARRRRAHRLSPSPRRP